MIFVIFVRHADDISCRCDFMKYCVLNQKFLTSLRDIGLMQTSYMFITIATF